MQTPSRKTTPRTQGSYLFSPKSSQGKSSQDAFERGNFEMKMKMLEFEENTRSADTVGAITDNLALRVQLQEKTVELERCNIILLKAKGAIQAFKAEKERLEEDGRNINERQIYLEETIQNLKNERDNGDHELELLSLKNTLTDQIDKHKFQVSNA